MVISYGPFRVCVCARVSERDLTETLNEPGSSLKYNYLKILFAVPPHVHAFIFCSVTCACVFMCMRVWRVKWRYAACKQYA